MVCIPSCSAFLHRRPAAIVAWANYIFHVPDWVWVGGENRDPVVAQDGHTYERSYILRWLKDKKTSPKVRRIVPFHQHSERFRLARGKVARRVTLMGRVFAIPPCSGLRAAYMGPMLSITSSP